MVYLHCTFVFTIDSLFNSNINIYIHFEINMIVFNTVDNSYTHVTLLSYRIGHLWPLNAICCNLIQKRLNIWCLFGVSLVEKVTCIVVLSKLQFFLEFPIQIILYYGKMKNEFFLLGTWFYLYLFRSPCCSAFKNVYVVQLS